MDAAVFPDSLVAAAQRLAPVLRERARNAERERRLPVENVADLRAAGLFRILQPERCGGRQLDFHVHLDVVEEIAKGCASTAWCLGVLQIHSWLVGLLPREAQDEIYLENPDALVAAVLNPRGSARREGGGYRLEGFWPFASGCERSDWLILGARVLDDGGEIEDEACFAVPVAEISIKDDWHAAGLRGTGSCSVTGKDVFVPERRHISFRRARKGSTPGGEIHPGTLYRAPLAPPLALALCGPAVGLAEGAIRDFIDFVPGRIDPHLRAAPQIEDSLTHRIVADARAGVDAARALLHRTADDIHEAAERNGRMRRMVRARVRMDCAYAVKLCMEAVENVFLACGGAGLSEANPVQRAWRDVHAINQHATLQFRTNSLIYGRTLLGLDPGTDIL